MQWRRTSGKQDYIDPGQQQDVAPKRGGAPRLSAVVIWLVVIVAITRLGITLWKNIGTHEIRGF
jgi:hypothetical protein